MTEQENNPTKSAQKTTHFTLTVITSSATGAFALLSHCVMAYNVSFKRSSC